MAGIRTDDIFKKMISYILDSYSVSIKNEDKFKVNYHENNDEEVQEYLNWRGKGDILGGENISYDFKYSVLCLEGTYYIVLENYIKRFKLEFLNEVELNLGMFIFLFKELKYYPKLNATLDKEEVVDIIDIIDGEYNCHDFNKIKSLFTDIRVFKVSDDCQFNFNIENLKDTVNRILSLILIEEYRSRRFCYFKDDTLSEYETIIMTDIKYFPYENIFISLLENKPNKVFLEIYRIIERLYPYVMINKFKNECKSKIDLDVFLLEEALKSINWNHKEEDCIKLLFEQLKIEETDKIKDIKAKSTLDENLNLATWIYRIRNTIVHLSLKGNIRNVDVKVALESDEILNFIIPKLPMLYKKCFDN